jgi:hypothetical protein
MNLSVNPGTSGALRDSFSALGDLSRAQGEVARETEELVRKAQQADRAHDLALSPSQRALTIADAPVARDRSKYDETLSQWLESPAGRRGFSKNLHKELIELRSKANAQRAKELGGDMRISGRELGNSLAGSIELLKGDYSYRNWKDAAELGAFTSDFFGKHKAAKFFETVSQSMGQLAPAVHAGMAIKAAYSQIVQYFANQAAPLLNKRLEAEDRMKNVLANRFDPNAGKFDDMTDEAKKEMDEYFQKLRTEMRDSRMDVKDREHQGVDRFNRLSQAMAEDPRLVARLINMQRQRDKRVFAEAPESRADLQDYLIKYATREDIWGGDRKQLQIARFMGVLEEVRAEIADIKKREDAQRAESERKGDQLTEGVRNRTIWNENNQRLAAVEKANWDRFLDWNPH